uniref:Uncharacterized protein n=1 Tax=uncultured prokaryote TaxID=198431 RepID=A0A0H5Q338_9ZZZZ|nr:hypothetical protein [uncultured prokaryote]
MVFPVLERVCVVLDAAKTAKETSKEGLRDSIAKAEADLLPMLYQAVNQLDIFIDDAAASLGVPSDSLGQSHAAIGKAMMGAISDPEGGSGATHSGRKAPSINPRPVIRGSGIKNRGGKP